jgi:hypothetical protein
VVTCDKEMERNRGRRYPGEDRKMDIPAYRARRRGSFVKADMIQ